MADVHGVLPLDKPTGMSSFDVIRKLRPVLGTRKVGHTGTLDPFASGLMVLLFGHYTRLADLMVAQDKRYLATVDFSGRTTTDDVEGDIVEPGPGRVPDRAAIEAVLPRFVGDIEQVPPVYSAIKKGGEALYKKARRGETVEVPARTVHVAGIDIVEHSPETLVLDVRCGKGTYIRALARDIGAALSAPCHLSALRRTEVGPYEVDSAARLDEVRGPDRLQTGRAAVRGVRLTDVDASSAERLWQGKTVSTAEPDGDVLCFLGDDPVAWVRIERGQMRVKRGFPPA